MFEKILLKVHKQLRNNIYKKWNRVLPFSEEFTDRWEKANYLGFGKGTSIYDSSVVMGDVLIGENTWIGPYTLLDGSGGVLKIGDNCSIASGTHIYTHDTVKKCLSGNKLPIEKSRGGGYLSAETAMWGRCA